MLKDELINFDIHEYSLSTRQNVVLQIESHTKSKKCAGVKVVLQVCNNKPNETWAQNKMSLFSTTNCASSNKLCSSLKVTLLNFYHHVKTLFSRKEKNRTASKKLCSS